MLQRSSAKADAAVAAKVPPKKSSAPLGKTVAPASKGAAAAAAKATGAKPTTSPATKSAIKGESRGNVPAAPAAALLPPPPPAPPAPTDREGLARVTYNHYNSFFPVDAAGKMLWRDIDDKYCLSYGNAPPRCLPPAPAALPDVTPAGSVWRALHASALPRSRAAGLRRGCPMAESPRRTPGAMYTTAHPEYSSTRSF